LVPASFELNVVAISIQLVYEFNEKDLFCSINS